MSSQGPNPWKVAIILEELKLDYETKIMDFGDLKKEPFESSECDRPLSAAAAPDKS